MRLPTGLLRGAKLRPYIEKRIVTDNHSTCWQHLCCLSSSPVVLRNTQNIDNHRLDLDIAAAPWKRCPFLCYSCITATSSLNGSDIVSEI